MKMKEDYDYKSVLAQELIAYDFMANFSLELKETPNLTISEFYEKQMKLYLDVGVAPELFSAGVIISSLYVTIVLLKEDIYEQLDSKLTIQDIGIRDIQVSVRTVKQLLRRMRNALAHGNIKIYKDYSIELYDVNPKNSDDVFVLELTCEQLHNLTNKLFFFIRNV